MSDPLQRFTENLRRTREASGLTQEAIALEAGMDPSYYNKIENGRIDPSIRMVTRVAVAMGATASDLLHGVVWTGQY